MSVNRTFSVAPMMDWTDRHCRVFHRLLSARALLYTEMVTAQAVIHGDRARLLGFDPREHPVALQLGGSDPALLAEAARIGEGFGYDEINLNVGCPSDRVQSGRFGACLMAEPDLVAACVAAMINAVQIPVTVKCRIGIDDQDEDEDLSRFVETVSGAGVTSFTVHARKAWLDGLSPKENRDIPPLNYARVERLKQARPDLEIVLNGGIDTLDAATAHLGALDGVMMGRAAYHNPWMLSAVDETLFGDPPFTQTRHDIVAAMADYAAEADAPLHHITRHMMGLFQNCPGARGFRRHISENVHKDGAGPDLLIEAAAHVPVFAEAAE